MKLQKMLLLPAHPTPSHRLSPGLMLLCIEGRQLFCPAGGEIPWPGLGGSFRPSLCPTAAPQRSTHFCCRKLMVSSSPASQKPAGSASGRQMGWTHRTHRGLCQGRIRSSVHPALPRSPLGSPLSVVGQGPVLPAQMVMAQECAMW